MSKAPAKSRARRRVVRRIVAPLEARVEDAYRALGKLPDWQRSWDGHLVKEACALLRRWLDNDIAPYAETEEFLKKVDGK